MKTFLALACITLLAIFGYLTFRRPDCGEVEHKAEHKQLGKSERIIRTTFTPSRDWRGCLVEVRSEITYYTPAGDLESKHITTQTYRKDGEKLVPLE